MKKKLGIVALSLLLGCSHIVKADPVEEATARKVASTYVNINCKQNAAITLAATYGTNNMASVYVYNIGNEGFILVSGDDEVEPVLGYSFSGTYDTTQLNPTFVSWLSAYRHDIAAIQQQAALGTKSYHDAHAVSEWQALKAGDASFYTAKAGKNVDALVQSQWDQGVGYNNLCPSYSGGYGGHAYTGCVATAMAQIIRYWGYPTTGFSNSSYVHGVYGRLKVDHDSVTYDFANMPNRVQYYSPQVEQQAVSLLCYHCGVAVHMDYQHAGNADGSGAHTEDVPAALTRFGYVGSKMVYMTTVGTDNWITMLRNELDAGRPILYRGISGTYGHAFVCDGYQTSNNKFHFNWGWSGYQDGYFTLTNMNGYTSGQGAVLGIQPSGLASLTSTYYVDAEGTGDGTSWDNATSHLYEAMVLRGLYKSGNMWLKEGTYYGDTTANTAFALQSGVHIYGGFQGTETALADREEGHLSTLDGGDQRAILSTSGLSKDVKLDHLSFQHGRSSSVAVMKTNSRISLTRCEIANNVAEGQGEVLNLSDATIKYSTIHHNQAPEGTIVNMDGEIHYCRIENNEASQIVASSGGKVFSSLIAHNNGDAVNAISGGNYTNCNIVSNTGVGVHVSNKTTLRNTVVWNNASAIEGTDTNITFCAADAAMDEAKGNVELTPENTGAANSPHFTLCSGVRGVSDTNDSWRLFADSPLVDAGDTNITNVPGRDLDDGLRMQFGRLDIGCYEYGNVAIPEVAPVLSTLRVYPNPATTHITVEIDNPSDATVQIYDLAGRRVLSSTTAKTIDVSNLQSGVYVVRSGAAISKLVICR